MNDSIPEIAAEAAELVDLGLVLGENQTFGLIAGRCSAAQAASLRRLREEGKFKRIVPCWRDFCSRYLRMSGSEADRIIQYWEEFGPGYFDLAQLIRISPTVYRAIAPAIQDGALHANGDAIGLSVENSRQLAAAVAELRRAIPKKPKKPPVPLAMHERLAELDHRCTAFISEFAEISRLERCGENWLAFTSILSRVTSALRRIELENGLA